MSGVALQHKQLAMSVPFSILFDPALLTSAHRPDSFGIPAR